MRVEVLRQIPTIREFFNITQDADIPEGTKLLLETMTEVIVPKGKNIVCYGATCDDGMYILLEGTATVYNGENQVINNLGCGDFIGEMGLINDDVRAATVRATSDVRCANISKSLFESLAMTNRKIYGTFINMLYNKTTKLVTERERIQSELAIATKIQSGCLENDFTEFNKLSHVAIAADMRPAKEVGGDFYDVFQIDDSQLCFLVADVSGKGIPAALFMSMAKTHIKNYASLGLPLQEVAYRVNNQLCYKNEEEMFVTAFICVLNVRTNELTFVNAGHNPPFFQYGEKGFEMLKTKANLVFGMIENVPYEEQKMVLKEGDSMYLYTDGVTEALNLDQQLFGTARLQSVLNQHREKADRVTEFISALYDAVDDFAFGEPQADDITMLYLTRK